MEMVVEENKEIKRCPFFPINQALKAHYHSRRVRVSSFAEPHFSIRTQDDESIQGGGMENLAMLLEESRVDDQETTETTPSMDSLSQYRHLFQVSY